MSLKSIFFVFVLISIAGLSTASYGPKESNDEYEPGTYRNHYLDMIPGAYDGTYKRVTDDVSIQGKSTYGNPDPVYTKDTEGSITYDGIGGPGLTDYKTKITYVPHGKQDTVINIDGGEVPTMVGRTRNTGVNLSPEWIAFFVALFASING